MGNRLVKFLSSILPTHTEYFSNSEKAAKARDRSQDQLVTILKYLDQIAMLVDEQEREDFVSNMLSEDATEEHSTNYKDENENTAFYFDSSVSTERLSITTLTTADTSMAHSEYQQALDRSSQNHSMLISPAQLDSDRSAIMYSIDVMLETASPPSSNANISAESIVIFREDPNSTPTNTILRMIDLKKHPMDGKSKQNPLTRMDGLPIETPVPCKLPVACPEENKKCQPSALPSKPQVAKRAPFPVCSKALTPRRQDDTSMTQSRTLEMDTSEDRCIRIISPASEEPELQRSPGGTVRSKVRAWPPKPDPLSEATHLENLNVPTRQAHIISGDLRSASPEHNFTPQPLGQHRNAVTPPAAAQPLLQQQSPETIHLQFKPWTDLKRTAMRMSEGSPYKKEHESIHCRLVIDTHSGKADSESDRTSSSPSCSFYSFQDSDENGFGADDVLFKYSSINSPDIEKVASGLDHSHSSDQDLSNACQESHSQPSREKSDRSNAGVQNADASLTTSYAASAINWSSEQDESRTVDTTFNRQEKEAKLLKAVSVGSTRFKSPAHDEKFVETNNQVVFHEYRDNNAGVTENLPATQDRFKVNTSASNLSVPSQNYTRRARLDSTSGSMGIVTSHAFVTNQELFGTGKVPLEVPSSQTMLRDISAFLDTYECQHTSRIPVSRTLSGSNNANEGLLACSCYRDHIPFDFSENSRHLIRELAEHEVSTSSPDSNVTSPGPQDSSPVETTSRMSSLILSSNSGALSNKSISDGELSPEQRDDEIIIAAQTDGKRSVPYKELKLGATDDNGFLCRFDTIDEDLTKRQKPRVSRYCTLAKKENDYSSPLSTSFASSAASWSFIEGSVNKFVSRGSKFSDEHDLLEDSVGKDTFPAFTHGPNATNDLVAQYSMAQSRSNLISEKDSSFTDKVSVIRTVANGNCSEPLQRGQAASLAIKKSSSRGKDHQKDWLNVMDSHEQDYGPDRELQTSLAREKAKSDRSIFSVFVNANKGFWSPGRPQATWEQSWAANGQSPPPESQASGRPRSGTSAKGYNSAPGQPVQSSSSKSNRALKSTREVVVQKVSFPNSHAFGATMKVHDPFLPCRTSQEALTFQGKTPSPFKIESKAVQRMRISMNVNRKRDIASLPSTTSSQGMCLSGTFPVVIKGTGSLPSDRSENLALSTESESTARIDERRRGNKIFCRKQKDDMNRLLNEQETNDLSFSSPKTPHRNRSHHFKNCVRSLID